MLPRHWPLIGCLGCHVTDDWPALNVTEHIHLLNLYFTCVFCQHSNFDILSWLLSVLKSGRIRVNIVFHVVILMHLIDNLMF